MYCNYCGKEIKDNAKFCDGCGKPTAQANATSTKVAPAKVVEEPTYKPKKKKSKGLKRFGIVLAVLIVLSMVGALLDDETTSTETQGDTTKQVSETETTTESATKNLAIGETYSLDGLEFTLNSFSFSQYAGGLEGCNPISDNVYCNVFISVKNTTNNTIALRDDGLFSKSSNYAFTLVYKGNVDYNSTWCDYTDFFFAHDELIALGTLDNVVVTFEVPKEVETADSGLVIELTPNSITSDDKATWTLK